MIAPLRCLLNTLEFLSPLKWLEIIPSGNLPCSSCVPTLTILCRIAYLDPLTFLIEEVYAQYLADVFQSSYNKESSLLCLIKNLGSEEFHQLNILVLFVPCFLFLSTHFYSHRTRNLICSLCHSGCGSQPISSILFTNAW